MTVQNPVYTGAQQVMEKINEKVYIIKNSDYSVNVAVFCHTRKCRNMETVAVNYKSVVSHYGSIGIFTQTYLVNFNCNRQAIVVVFNQ